MASATSILFVIGALIGASLLLFRTETVRQWTLMKWERWPESWRSWVGNREFMAGTGQLWSLRFCGVLLVAVSIMVALAALGMPLKW